MDFIDYLSGLLEGSTVIKEDGEMYEIKSVSLQGSITGTYLSLNVIDKHGKERLISSNELSGLELVANDDPCVPVTEAQHDRIQ